MTNLTLYTRRLQNLARLVENPSLFSLRQRGGVMDTYFTLNQPWFQTYGIQTVFDIGANTGQFAITMNAILPHAKIYSFEPLPDCFEQLQEKLKKADNFSAFNLGIGDQSGTLTFERSDLTLSSSFLKMTDIHKTAFPRSSQSHTVEVKVEPLDLIAQKLEITDPLMIKIDVQGYEKHVIQGGKHIISRAKLLIVETSFEQLYQDQATFHEVYQLLINLGFEYKGSLEQIRNSQTGQVLQEDSIFVNTIQP